MCECCEWKEGGYNCAELRGSKTYVFFIASSLLDLDANNLVEQCDAADKGVQAGGNKNATAAASAAKDGKKDGKVGASCGGVVLPRGE